jgi:hypothetical protein
MIEVMEKYGVKGTVALNSDVCRHYPRIIEEGNKLGWEWMGHGTNNSTLFNTQSEAEERALIGEVISTITQSVGKAPRGWLSPALSQTVRTLDILAENGIDYVCNWVLCHDATPVHTAKRNCTRDEGGPFGFGNQVLISGHRKLLWSKAMVVSVAETPGQDFGRQGRERRAQANRCRSVESGLGDVETGG